MPKNIYTPRNELVCGKIEMLIEMARILESPMMVDLLADVMHDCSRMEQMLIYRKEQAEKHGI